MADAILAAVELTKRLAALPDPPKVMLGGQLVQCVPELADRLRADAVPRSLEEALRTAAVW